MPDPDPDDNTPPRRAANFGLAYNCAARSLGEAKGDTGGEETFGRANADATWTGSCTSGDPG